VVASALVSINEVTPGQVSTGMGDRLRAGTPPRFVKATFHYAIQVADLVCDLRPGRRPASSC